MQGKSYSSPVSLVALSAQDTWTQFDAYEGTIIFGGNGSGKTTGSGNSLANAFLKNGFGGLVLTVKIDEANRWKKYLQDNGRIQDLVLIEPNQPFCLNILEYESMRRGIGAGITYELVRLLQTAMDGGRERSRSNDPYWDDAVAQLLTNAIDLVLLARGKVTLNEVVDVIRSAPYSDEDVASLKYDMGKRNALRQAGKRVWAGSSKCADLLSIAWKNTSNDDRKYDFLETYAYFIDEFALLDNRTRSNILSTLMSRLTGLLRTPFRQLFSATTTIKPEDSFNGKVIILNLPVKEYGEAGRFAQILFKTVWQRAVERRGDYGCPVFIWADEAQFFVTKYDMLFQQTARSSRVASVYLTQSVVNFRASLDSSADSTSISDSLLGNLQTKIFHANACPISNEYAERLFGSDLQWTNSTSVGSDGVPQIGAQKVMLPILPAIRFSTLKKGGLVNDKVVDSYVFQAGKIWKGDNGKHLKNWLLAQFKQEF